MRVLESSARALSLAWMSWLVLGASGCYLVHEREGAATGAEDEAPNLACEPTALVRTVVQTESIDEVDLLLMIDNSNSMTEEQQSIVLEIPRIVQMLTSGALTAGAAPSFPPVRSLHIGIVTSDLGVGDVTGLPFCDPGFGDDGLIQTRPRFPRASCASDTSSRYPRGVFDFEVGDGNTPMQFANDVACVATLGTAGCGFEQQLEAPLKAISLTPLANGASPVEWTRAGYRPPTFYAGTFGHGSDPATNGGFLRPSSVLAVVLITDEDDCSTPNPEIFSSTDPRYGGVDLNLRCFGFPEELYPVQRYVDGLLGLRASAHLLSFSAITGIPPELGGESPSIILEDPSMTPHLDVARTNSLAPVCVSPGGRGVAYPAQRIAQVAEGLAAAGASVSLQSICDTDFSAAFDAVIGHVVGTLEASCLAAPVPTDASGAIDCDVLEVLPAIGSGAAIEHCADLPHAEAYVLEGLQDSMSADGTIAHHERCRIRQLTRETVGAEAGWLYDEGSIAGWSSLTTGCAQRIGLSVIATAPGADMRLVCCP